MASDMFGDSMLFEEFERERPHNLYIPSETESNENHVTVPRDCDSSSAESGTEEGIESSELTETPKKNSDHHDDVQLDDQDVSYQRDTTVLLSSESCHTNTTQKSALDEKLVKENKSLHRYARLVDTTRCNPTGDESPAIQIIYQNNKFARKYRDEIERFLSYLIEKDSGEKDRIPELQLQSGGLTSADLSKNPSDNIDVRLRRAHAYIGSSRMYHDFIIDTLGWPLVDENPNLTHGRLTTLYEQPFPNSLPCDEVEELRSSFQSKKQRSTCFNCSGDHILSKCTEPRNQKLIRQNQQLFREKNNTPKLGLSTNSKQQDTRFEHLKPGVCSSALRDALGLHDDQLPPFIYAMRLLGYPPGWAMEAQKLTSGLALFDKHGKEVAIEGEDIDKNQDPSQPHLNSLDVNKIIEYPGFTIEVPQDYTEECHLYNMPPIQPHQLKSTVTEYVNSQEAERKRRSDIQKELLTKRRKLESETDMDVVTEEDSTPKKFILPPGHSPSLNDPPLPNNSPFRPPLPVETPPRSTTSTPSSQQSAPMSDGERGDLSDSMTLEDLESRYKELQNAISGDVGFESDSQSGESKSATIDLTNSDQPDSQPCDQPDSRLRDQPDKTAMIIIDDDSIADISTDKAAAIDLTDSKSSSVIMIDDSPRDSPRSPDDDQITKNADIQLSNSSKSAVTHSIERSHGTPVRLSVIPNLPDRCQFGDGMDELIPFENLPEATGRFEKLRQMLAKLRNNVKDSLKK